MVGGHAGVNLVLVAQLLQLDAAGQRLDRVRQLGGELLEAGEELTPLLGVALTERLGLILLVVVTALDQRQEDLVQRRGQRVQRLSGDLTEQQLLKKVWKK